MGIGARPLVDISAYPLVLVKTELGDIKIEVYEVKAPATEANFLRYVDNKLYDGTAFFRTVTMNNQPNNDVKIEVIQGGQVDQKKAFPPIDHETTQTTGLRHLNDADDRWEDHWDDEPSEVGCESNDYDKGKQEPRAVFIRGSKGFPSIKVYILYSCCLLIGEEIESQVSAYSILY